MNNKKGNKKGNKQAGYIGAAIYSIILALPFFKLFESYIVVAVIAIAFMSITITGFAIDEKKRCKTLEQKQSKSKLEIIDTKIEETHKPISEAHTLKTWCLLNGEYGKLVKAEWLGEVNEQTNIDIDRGQQGL